jgi:hypothetical protein
MGKKTSANVEVKHCEVSRSGKSFTGSTLSNHANFEEAFR